MSSIAVALSGLFVGDALAPAPTAYFGVSALLLFAVTTWLFSSPPASKSSLKSACMTKASSARQVASFSTLCCAQNDHGVLVLVVPGHVPVKIGHVLVQTTSTVSTLDLSWSRVPSCLDLQPWSFNVDCEMGVFPRRAVGYSETRQLVNGMLPGGFPAADPDRSGWNPTLQVPDSASVFDLKIPPTRPSSGDTALALVV
ncbi:hypothetical protein MRX96_055237 [Rhipicephalus microplus]